MVLSVIASVSVPCIAAATRIGNVAVVKETGPFSSPTLYVVINGNVFVSATNSFPEIAVSGILLLTPPSSSEFHRRSYYSSP